MMTSASEPRDRRVDRAINMLIAAGFAGWSLVLWFNKDDLNSLAKELRVVSQQNALILERLADIAEDLRDHENTYAHEGAREALQVLTNSVTRMSDELGRLGNTSEKRDDIHMNRITRMEERVLEMENDRE